MVAVERGEQAVPEDEVLQSVAQLDEGEVHALGVQLAVELLEHVGRADVDVGDRLALQHDPLGTALVDEVANLLAEHAGVGEEQRCLPAVDEDPALAPRRVGDWLRLCQPSPGTWPSTSPCGHQLRLKKSRMESTTAIRMPCSTPKNTTPPVATSDRTNELLRTCR